MSLRVWANLVFELVQVFTTKSSMNIATRVSVSRLNMSFIHVEPRGYKARMMETLNFVERNESEERLSRQRKILNNFKAYNNAQIVG